MGGENQSTTFRCLGGGTHTFEGGRTVNGEIVVVFDGETKVLEEDDVPIVDLVGSMGFFSQHEHCLFSAQEQVQAVLDNITSHTRARIRQQTNQLLEMGLASGAPASDLLVVHERGRASESGDPQRIKFGEKIFTTK